MFDLIPLAGARREMTHGQRPPRFVGELLQLPFPQAQARPVAAARVRRDEHGVGLRVQVAAFRTPSAADGGHRKRAGVMVRPHVDEALVAPHVVDAVGIRARHLGTREIVALHAEGLLRRTPLLAGVRVVADQFLLFGVDRKDREPGRQGPLDAGVDMAKLGIPVGMVRPLLGLARALKTVVLVVEELGHLHVTDRMTLAAQVALPCVISPEGPGWSDSGPSPSAPSAGTIYLITTLPRNRSVPAGRKFRAFW